MRRIPASETLLRMAVRRVLQEAPQPDQPGVAPGEALGQYAFPAGRLDRGKDIEEPDTDLESRFYDALKRHYEENNRGALQTVWPEVIELKQQGLYPALLVPPAGRVYRMMTLDPDRAALFLGVDEDEVKKEPGVAHSSPNPPSFKPRGFISSWTLDPELMVGESSIGQSFHDSPGQCTLLLVADTGSGEFLMNPEGFAQGWRIGSNFSLESEVIGGGEIPLVAASWMWHGRPNFDMLKFNDELDALISGVSSSLKDLARRGQMSPDKRAVEEQAIWSEYVQGVDSAARFAGGVEEGQGVEPIEIKAIKSVLGRWRAAAENPVAFEELRQDINRGDAIEDVVNKVGGRWLVTAAEYFKTEIMATLRRVDLGPRGPKTPRQIVKRLLAAT